MFTDLVEPPKPERKLPTKWLVGAAAALGLCAVGASAAGLWAWSNLRSSDCVVTPHDDLTMDQLVAMKKRIDAYVESQDEHLFLSDDELSMLLEHRMDIPVRVDLRASDLTATMAIPSGDACYPVRFHGSVNVSKGVAVVVPHALEVGAVDLSFLTRGSEFRLLPEHMPNPESAKLLHLTKDLQVTDGQARLHVSPRALKLR